MKNAFDDIESFKLSPETVERLAKAKPRLEAKRKRQARIFAMLPIEQFQITGGQQPNPHCGP